MKKTTIEILKNSKLKDNSNPKRPIFITNKKYKDYILSITENALDKDKAFNEDYGDKGIKEEPDNQISFQLLSSNRKELNFLYYNDVKEFLKENGIKKIENEIFIYEKKDSMDKFIKCYQLYNQLKEFLLEIKTYYDETDKKITIYYNQPIIISEKIDNIDCEDIENKIKILQELKNEIDSEDKQTKEEFLKKAIHDILKNKIKNNSLTITDIFSNLKKIQNEYYLIKRAYIDSLDTDKIKDDFKNKYQETINFLQTIISNLYTKTLFIPLSLIFGISQKLSIQNENTTAQITIYLLLTIFLLFLGYLIYGHFFLLENVKLYINEIKKDSKEINFLKDKIPSIDKLYKGVRNRLRVIIGIIIISWIILTGIYYKSLTLTLTHIYQTITEKPHTPQPLPQ